MRGYFLRGAFAPSSRGEGTTSLRIPDDIDSPHRKLYFPLNHRWSLKCSSVLRIVLIRKGWAITLQPRKWLAVTVRCLTIVASVPLTWFALSANSPGKPDNAVAT